MSIADVGDNIDENLQAAPPGLLAGLGAGAVLGAAGAWQGAIDDHTGQPFHLPGERENVAAADVSHYQPVDQEFAHEDANDQRSVHDNFQDPR